MPHKPTTEKLLIEQTIDQKIEALLANSGQNAEAFRLEAAMAYESFTDENRKLAKLIQTKSIKIQTLLDHWKHVLAPAIKKIEQKSQDKDFRHLLEKDFYLTPDSAAKKTEQLVNESKHELLQITLDHLYAQDFAAQKHHAASFFSQDAPTLQDFYDRFVNFTAYVQAAQIKKITIYDSAGSWFERQRTINAIKKERQLTAKQQHQKLTHIETEVNRLQTGLLGELLKNQWDAWQVQQVYTTYQNQRARLSKKDQISPIKQLAAFDSATRSFKDEEIERLAKLSATKSLKAIRHIAESIDDLLLEFFDLTDSQKKQLLEDASTYKKLQNERTEIEKQQQIAKEYTSKKPNLLQLQKAGKSI